MVKLCNLTCAMTWAIDKVSLYEERRGIPRELTCDERVEGKRIKYIPMTLLRVNGSPSTSLANIALKTRPIAPIGANMTIGRYPIVNIEPIILAIRYELNPATHSGLRKAFFRCSIGNIVSFSICDFRCIASANDCCGRVMKNGLELQ